MSDFSQKLKGEYFFVKISVWYRKNKKFTMIMVKTLFKGELSLKIQFSVPIFRSFPKTS